MHSDQGDVFVDITVEPIMNDNIPRPIVIRKRWWIPPILQTQPPLVKTQQINHRIEIRNGVQCLLMVQEARNFSNTIGMLASLWIRAIQRPATFTQQLLYIDIYFTE